MTVAPLRTSSRETARPIPAVAPVTMITRPSKSSGAGRYSSQSAFAGAPVMTSVRSVAGARRRSGSVDGGNVARELLDRLRRHDALPRLHAEIGEAPRARQHHALE